MTPICIYHGNCADGFGSAWVVNQAIADVEFHPGVYQTDPPDVTGREVIMVDFSYKRPVLLEMAAKAKSILIIDHHKTAAEDLVGLPDTVATAFNMNYSGAVLTWFYYFPGKPVPKLLLHIEDRDLWKFSLPGTREIQAAVFSYPYDFAVWDALADSFDAFGDTRLIAEGRAIERKHFKDIDELLKVVTREFIIGGHKVKIANLPYTLTSDAGHTLATDAQFGGCYWDTPNGRVFSLRSAEGGIDVSEIAKQYGGGGHKDASGFMVPFDQLDQFEIVGH